MGVDDNFIPTATERKQPWPGTIASVPSYINTIYMHVSGLRAGTSVTPVYRAVCALLILIFHHIRALSRRHISIAIAERHVVLYSCPPSKRLLRHGKLPLQSDTLDGRDGECAANIIEITSALGSVVLSGLRCASACRLPFAECQPQN